MSGRSSPSSVGRSSMPTTSASATPSGDSRRSAHLRPPTDVFDALRFSTGRMTPSSSERETSL